MPVALAEIIKRVPSDCEERVERAKTRFNAAVREALRRESALRLSRGDGGADGDAVTVPIRVLPGLPAPLRAVELGEVEVVALTLSQWREALEALRRGSVGAQEMVAELTRDSRFTGTVRGAEIHLEPVQAWAERLLRLIALANPLAKILIEQDVLGIYTYESPPRLPDPPRNPSIELYWAIIGLVAPAVGVTVEDLTVVVLAHELGHAYSHVGSDIDGEHWPTAAFRSAEQGLREGVAQYYTQRVCFRLERQCPGALRAYEAVLKHQPKAYHVHESWVAQSSPEEVRFAMIEARRRGLTSLAGFDEVVAEARIRWRDAK